MRRWGWGGNQRLPRLAIFQAEVFPLPPPPPAPSPPFFRVSYLFVFGGSHFSSSPLPGVCSPRGNEGCEFSGRLADTSARTREPGRALPASLRGRVAAHTQQPAKRRGPPWSDLYGDPHLYRGWKAKPDSTTIVPSGSLEKADSLKPKVLRDFLISFPWNRLETSRCK